MRFVFLHGYEIDDFSLYEESDLCYFNDSMDLHYEYETDIDLG